MLDDRQLTQTRGSAPGAPRRDRARGPSRVRVPHDGSTIALRSLAARSCPLAGFGHPAAASSAIVGDPSAADPNLGRLLLFALAIVGHRSRSSSSYLLAADLTAPAARDRGGRGPRLGGRPHDADPGGRRRRARAASPRATTGWPPTSSGATGAGPDPRRDRGGRRRATASTSSPTRAADDARDRLRDDRRGDLPRRPGRRSRSRSACPANRARSGPILRAGSDVLGVLFGRLPATRRWERADQDLLDLFASDVAVAIRNAQLFAQVEAQNAQLLELDAAKDDFLRGVSHNLQTPLTSIRALRRPARARPARPAARDHHRAVRAAVAHGPAAPDRHPAGVGDLPPTTRRRRPRVAGPQGLGGARRATTSSSRRRPDRGLARGRRRRPARPGPVGAARQRAQVRRAQAGRGRRIRSSRRPTASGRRSRTADPGSLDEDRGPAVRSVRAGQPTRTSEGSGLGLYVSRELCRAMDGDLVLEPPVPGRGAAFSIYLPGEPATEG